MLVISELLFFKNHKLESNYFGLIPKSKHELSILILILIIKILIKNILKNIWTYKI